MIDIFKASEKLMSMDDATWARHASPLSVYSRMTCLPLIVAALWSRVWLGWFALIPLALALLWTWANPRLFNPPNSLTSWASRGVLGERVFLNRATTPIPTHHHTMATILTTAMALFSVILIYGVWSFPHYSIGPDADQYGCMHDNESVSANHDIYKVNHAKCIF
jgi:hypothetical protein